MVWESNGNDLIMQSSYPHCFLTAVQYSACSEGPATVSVKFIIAHEMHCMHIMCKVQCDALILVLQKRYSACIVEFCTYLEIQDCMIFFTIYNCGKWKFNLLECIVVQWIANAL